MFVTSYMSMVVIIWLPLDKCSHRGVILPSGWIVGKSWFFFCTLFIIFPFWSQWDGCRSIMAQLHVLFSWVHSLPSPSSWDLVCQPFTSPRFSLCANLLTNRQPECLSSFVQPRDLGWAIGRKYCPVHKIVVITPFITVWALCYSF